MPFKFRLEASLRLAEQEMDIEQGLLAQELRTLREATEQKDLQAQLLNAALEKQKIACLEEPQMLSLWQRYCYDQRNILLKREKEVEEQNIRVEKQREKLLECRIKTEKYKRLKEKKIRLFHIAELKKEQTEIDEIAQNLRGWKTQED
ncbi:flagellar FliJ family protein [Dehalobacter sp.]|uniref:flagellar export protein FliJ n=1 Tax=Dehalobacter sp. TaxID=1962289 RepID=UPI00258A7FF9|nr:flagellar FliJ family protein [Dehalobacter sp.]MCG1026415.1 flagellar FliJ family protein [Dehalobacter sp.]